MDNQSWKLTPKWIEDQILTEEYLIRGGRFMVCILFTKGGYYVTGESAPINPAEFTEELGRKYSREDAVDKIWRIEGIIARKQHYGEVSEVLESVSNRAYVKLHDIVYLKSGGPAMLVKEITDDKVHCHWVDGDDSVCKHWFDVACLSFNPSKDLHVVYIQVA